MSKEINTEQRVSQALQIYKEMKEASENLAVELGLPKSAGPALLAAVERRNDWHSEVEQGKKTSVSFWRSEKVLSVSFPQYEKALEEAFGPRGVNHTNFLVSHEAGVSKKLYFIHHRNPAILPAIADDLVTLKDERVFSESQERLIDAAIQGLGSIIDPTPEVAADKARWIPSSPPPHPRGGEHFDIRWIDPILPEGFRIK